MKSLGFKYFNYVRPFSLIIEYDLISKRCLYEWFGNYLWDTCMSHLRDATCVGPKLVTPAVCLDAASVEVDAMILHPHSSQILPTLPSGPLFE